MTFTNTKSVENVLYWYEVWREVNRQVKYQVDDQVFDQVSDQVFYQINPIKYEIDLEIRK